MPVSPLSRQQICESTSKKLNVATAGLKSVKTVIGLDGFVDEIIAVVDKRQDNVRYEPVRTIEALGKKILHAAGQSSNYELIVKHTKLGGNGPIMANALASIGLDVTYIGNLGFPNLHPVFEPFARRAKVISIAEPGHTDALEFDDGKLMLGKHEFLKEVNWENLLQRVGKEQIKKLFDGSGLIHMSEIWEKLLTEIIPGGSRQRNFFVDLADPEKRTVPDILGALKLLTRFQEHLDVTLGLNLKEAGEIEEVLGLTKPANPESAVQESACRIREKLNIACVVVHPRRGAAAAMQKESAQFAGPFIQQPKISTGAGDHFNSGFCLGRLLNFTLEESLCTGVATSGYYVRTAESPSALQLAEFITHLPPAEG
jgi:sugar/nucleoside kinase (ribokinase family)